MVSVLYAWCAPWDRVPGCRLTESLGDGGLPTRIACWLGVAPSRLVGQVLVPVRTRGFRIMPALSARHDYLSRAG